MEQLEEMLLETLSFFSPMTAQMIILDLNREKIDSYPHLTLEDLDNALGSMVKRGIIQQTKKDDTIAWQRLFAKRKRWWQRLLVKGLQV